MNSPIKNENSKYRTRSIIGGGRAVNVSVERQEPNRQDFVVDSAGYFVWDKPVKKLEPKLKFL